MKLNVKSKNAYDSIKAVILAFVALLLGPATYAALMSALDSGDMNKYLMAMGFIVVGIVLIVIYRFVAIEDAKAEAEAEDEEEDEDVEEAIKESEPKEEPKVDEKAKLKAEVDAATEEVRKRKEEK